MKSFQVLKTPKIKFICIIALRSSAILRVEIDSCNSYEILRLIVAKSNFQSQPLIKIVKKKIEVE